MLESGLIPLSRGKTEDEKKRIEEWNKYVKGGRKGPFPANPKPVEKEKITLEKIWDKLQTLSRNTTTDFGTYKIPSDEYHEYKRLKRKFGVEQINLERVGLITVDTNPQWIKHAVYQALQDNIAPDESALCVREIFADLDLCDANGNPVKSRDWRFPVKSGYKKSDVWETIYDDTQDNDRKVILFTGYYTLSKQIFVNSIGFHRASIKVIEFQDAETLPVRFGRILLPTPVMYKRFDRPRIQVHVSSAGKGHMDRIALSGLVVEPLGNYMVG